MASRSQRKVFKKAPGGAVKVHLRKKKPRKATCASCGKTLAGVPRKRPYKMQTTKTKKRPQRLFGGQLCSTCSRKRIIASVRK